MLHSHGIADVGQMARNVISRGGPMEQTWLHTSESEYLPG